MLQRTRYILTGWYVLITLSVSIVFSVFIYTGVSRPLKDFSRLSELNKQNSVLTTPFPPPKPPLPFPTDVTPEMIEARVRTLLILVNIVLVFVSAGTGYFLAGKSLQPVKKILGEQNQFISDASHELRAPLTAIRTDLEVTLMNKQLDKEAQRVLRSNLNEVIYLQNLANDLLELNRYENEKNALHFTPNSLLDISERAITGVLPLLKEKQVTVDNQIQDSKVWGDKSSLVRLCTILLENAIKYSDARKIIALHSKLEGSNLIVKVVDQGIGIDEEDKKRIFDRFYRADKARSRYETPGYGLGLAIASLIVQKHAGHISVKSTFGKGSTFTVSLPLRSI